MKKKISEDERMEWPWGEKGSVLRRAVDNNRRFLKHCEKNGWVDGSDTAWEPAKIFLFSGVNGFLKGYEAAERDFKRREKENQ